MCVERDHPSRCGSRNRCGKRGVEVSTSLVARPGLGTRVVTTSFPWQCPLERRRQHTLCKARKYHNSLTAKNIPTTTISRCVTQDSHIAWQAPLGYSLHSVPPMHGMNTSDATRLPANGALMMTRAVSAEVSACVITMQVEGRYLCIHAGKQADEQTLPCVVYRVRLSSTRDIPLPQHATHGSFSRQSCSIATKGSW